MAKSVFEQASALRSDDALSKIAVGMTYLAEAFIDLSADLQEVKTLLNKARKDRNETSQRSVRKE